MRSDYSSICARQLHAQALTFSSVSRRSSTVTGLPAATMASIARLPRSRRSASRRSAASLLAAVASPNARSAWLQSPCKARQVLQSLISKGDMLAWPAKPAELHVGARCRSSDYGKTA